MQTSPAPHAPRLSLGLIEGFFGTGWSWQARREYAAWLPRAGYDFYLYAPKEDACLRRHWAQPWPEATLKELQQLATDCRTHGVAFGVGLTPLGAHHDYPAKRAALLAKVQLIDTALAPDILAVLFDDMPSDTPDLARLQLTIAHDIAAHTRARRLIFCPSFYSTDPILEKVFGAMPAGYWHDLGQGLDPRFDLFWTGPQVCSSHYPLDHLRWTAETLGRKPFLWDNYPVNDGRKACSFLHLKAFEHRPAELADYLAGHGVNPMKQPRLSRIPLATLPMSYRLGGEYDPAAAFALAAAEECGQALAGQLAADLPSFTQLGLDQLDETERQRLAARYLPFARQPGPGQACATEILGWLAGDYAFDPACLTG